MGASLDLAVTTGAWVAIASTAVYVLVAGPLLAACLYAVWRRCQDPDDHAVEDVQRFVTLNERARAELAATGSIERFVALKAEARAALWSPAADGERPRRPEFADDGDVQPTQLPSQREPAVSAWEAEERPAA